MVDLGQDVRDAARTWRRAPGIAAAAIAMFAAAIGATTAIFSVVKGVLIDPLPYREPAALVRIVHNIGGIEQPYFNDQIIATYGEHARAFDSVGVWVPSGEGVTITGTATPEEVRALTASRGYFVTLGTQPVVGQSFSPDDDRPDAENTVMLGESYWRSRYGGDEGAIGRSITVNGQSHRIIGVMPAHLTYAGPADILLPLRIDPARLSPFFRLNGIARMRPGITLADANADVARMLEIYFDTFKANTKRAVRWVPSLVPLKQDVVGDAGGTLWVVMATMAFVLLMVCANVANLLLVRTEGRRREFAIRTALGARWSRVARAMLVESLMLAALGGVLGLALAFAAVRLLVSVEPADLPRLAEITVDPGAALFAIGLSIFCCALVSLAPMVRLIGTRAATVIDLGGRGGTVTRRHQRSQNALVVAQIGLAVVLLVSAGLMIRTARALREVPAGFADPRTVQAFNLTLPRTVVPDLERVLRLQQDILDRLAAIPGVRSAAFTTRLPMDPADRWSAALSLEDQPAAPGTTPPNRQVKLVSPGSFQAFGTPVVAGRDFTWIDLHEMRTVAIVSANLAREHWGSPEAALGKRLRQFYGPSSAPWHEIVGVAGDVYDDGVHIDAPATVYWPARVDPKLFAGYQPRRASFVLRTDRAGTAALLDELRRAVWAVNPGLPLAEVRTLDVLYDRSMSKTTFTLALLAATGSLAVLLAVCGVYGVIAYAVTQRRREIGIRLALGAEAAAIRGLFLRRGALVAMAGVVIGLAGAAVFAGVMRAVLFGVTPTDPLTFTAAPLILAAAALAATYVPARRALAADPVETLRSE